MAERTPTVFVELEAQDHRSHVSSLVKPDFVLSVQKPQRNAEEINWNDWNDPNDPADPMDWSRSSKALQILVFAALIAAVYDAFL